MSKLVTALQEWAIETKVKLSSTIGVDSYIAGINDCVGKAKELAAPSTTPKTYMALDFGQKFTLSDTAPVYMKVNYKPLQDNGLLKPDCHLCMDISDFRLYTISPTSPCKVVD